MSLRFEPIGSRLRQDASEEELQRIWRAIQRRRARKSALGSALLAVAVISILVVMGIVSWWPSTNADPLRDEAGRALLLLESSTPRTTSLSDGSRVEMSTDSALEVLENDGDTFVCALRRGRAKFEVVPGGRRRWRIEIGSVAVEVVGTRFLVERREGSVTVEVEQGTVLVRGENVRDGVQKLQPGARLEVPFARPVNTEAARIPLPAASASSARAAVLESGDEQVDPESVPAPSVDLLALADGQRRRGDLKGAIQTLQLAIERSPDDTRAATAAFILGKLLLDGVGQPVEAQAAFRACLDRSPPAAIAEDALARLVEAQSRSGAREAALATAREYQRRYPNGRRLSDVRRWTGIR